MKKLQSEVENNKAANLILQEMIHSGKAVMDETGNVTIPDQQLRQEQQIA